MEWFRWVTVHPMLVHFTIGTLPIMVLAYAMAKAKGSERWTFAGDAVLAVTALATLATVGFGLVSFLSIDWPGGLSTWKWLHLGLGVGAGALLLGFAAFRIRARRQQAPSGAGTLAAAVLVALLLVANGWVGGEVLVYRSGIAVRAAGNGALAPSTTASDEGDPSDLMDAMGRLRGRWAAIQAEVATMVVQAPSKARFDRVVGEARAMAETALWLEELGDQSAAGANESRGESKEQRVAAMSKELSSDVRDVVAAANQEDLTGLAGAAGKLTEKCAKCHGELRW